MRLEPGQYMLGRLENRKKAQGDLKGAKDIESYANKNNKNRVWGNELYNCGYLEHGTWADPDADFGDYLTGNKELEKMRAYMRMRHMPKTEDEVYRSGFVDRYANDEC